MDTQPARPPARAGLGWQCPKCLKVLAPHLDGCPYCNNSRGLALVGQAPGAIRSGKAHG